MKILQVTHRFYPSSGGGAYVVYNICKSLQTRGHEVTLITSDYKFDVNYANELQKIGVNVLAFPCNFSISQFIITKEIKNWLEKNLELYDIIHLHGVRTYQNNQVVKYATKYHIPIIMHAHGSIERIGNMQFIKKIYDKIFLDNIINGVSSFIALSESEKKAYIRMGVSSEKILNVPNGVDLNDYKNLPKYGLFKKKHNIPPEKKILLYIGRIDLTKGIDVLVKSYSKVVQKNKFVHLVIAGSDTGYKKELLKIISNFNLEDDILFLDYISEYDKKCAFVDSTVFITPQFYGFPITFAESCACGLPIVTTNSGDYLDWINNYVGFCSKFDEIELAQKISIIVGDSEIRCRFSNNCRTIVEQSFNWQVISEKIERIYFESI